MGVWVVGYVGFALAYTLVIAGVVLVLARIVARWSGLTMPERVWPALTCTLFFVILTQHPLPDRVTMTCPHPAGKADFRLFGYVDEIGMVLAQAQGLGQGLGALLGNLTVMSMLMNFVLCVLIGILTARAGAGLWHNTLFAVALTLLVEVAQLTGLFGFYPCPYREFSVDDMVLNIGGVLMGTLIWRLFKGAEKRLPQN